MHQLVGYHRPTSVADATGLLEHTNHLALAGGTTLRHDGGGAPVEVVDLQSLGLDSITSDNDRVRLGAMVRLQTLADHDAVPDVVRAAARAEQPSTLRTLATVGGTIGAADAESLLVAALLAHDAVVHLADDRDQPLARVLEGGLAPGDLIIAVSAASAGVGALACTSRTPADTPIVGAVGRTTADGTRLALCGVAPVPIVVEPADIDALEPPGDFRGSPAYRRHLAAVLSARVLEELT